MRELLKAIEPKRDKRGSTQRTSLVSLLDGISKKKSNENFGLQARLFANRQSLTPEKQVISVSYETRLRGKIDSCLEGGRE